MDKLVKNRLLDIRFELKYKRQKDFAEFLGLKQSYYSKIENNAMQPDAEALLKICTKLKIKIEDVIYFSDKI